MKRIKVIVIDGERYLSKSAAASLVGVTKYKFWRYFVHPGKVRNYTFEIAHWPLYKESDVLPYCGHEVGTFTCIQN